VDFLLALIELFLLGVTAEALRAIIGLKSSILLQRWPVDPKFQVEGVVPHQPFFFSVNWAKLSFVWCKNLVRSFFRFVTMHACDGRTEFSSLDRVCISCSAVKINPDFFSIKTPKNADKETMLEPANISKITPKCCLILH